MRFFVKYIYWSRRIGLKRFQSDSGSLKISVTLVGGLWTDFGVFGSHLRSDNDVCRTGLSAPDHIFLGIGKSRRSDSNLEIEEISQMGAVYAILEGWLHPTFGLRSPWLLNQITSIQNCDRNGYLDSSNLHCCDTSITQLCSTDPTSYGVFCDTKTVRSRETYNFVGEWSGMSSNCKNVTYVSPFRQ